MTDKRHDIRKILDTGAEENPMDKLLQRPSFKAIQKPVGFAEEAPVRKKFESSALEGLPAIPIISSEEHRASLLLKNIVSEEMYRMIGAWLVIEEIEEGKTNISPEVAALEKRFKESVNTTIIYPDAWVMGLPLAEKLLKAARKKDDGVELEQQIAAIYSQCKYHDTMEGDILDFNQMLEPIVRAMMDEKGNVIAEDMELARKLSHQPFDEPAYNMFKRVRQAAVEGKEIDSKDLKMFRENGVNAMLYVQLPDEVYANAAPLMMKVMQHESFEGDEKEQFIKVIDAILKEPALTRQELKRIEDKPEIKEFAGFVVQSGFARFGSLMMASNMLQGYIDSEHNQNPGALEQQRAYMTAATVKAPYSDCAEFHRRALEQFEKSLQYLEEVKSRFSSDLLVSDTPQPDLAKLAAAEASILKLIPEKHEHKGPLYYLTKAHANARKKLKSGKLQENIDEFCTELSGIVERRNRYATAYQDLFADNVKALTAKVNSGEAYDKIDVNHQELIFALQELSRNLNIQIADLTIGVDARIKEQTKQYAGQKDYIEFLNGGYKTAANAINKELNDTDQAIKESLKGLLSFPHHKLKPGISFDQAAAAKEAGEETQDMYEVVQTELDDMSKAALAAERMVDYTRTIVERMRARQSVLDQYEAVEKRVTQRA